MNRRGFLLMFGAAMTLPIVGQMNESRTRTSGPSLRRVKGSLERKTLYVDPRTKAVRVR